MSIILYKKVKIIMRDGIAALMRKRITYMNLDEELVYHKAKLLLKIYRDVVWSIEDRVCEMEQEHYALGGKRLSEALDYLDDYDQNVNKKELEAELCSILKSKWLIEIVDKALIKIKNYPDYGAMYFDILYKQYIVKYKYSEKEIIEALNCERTTFYKRKKEAINLMGTAIWGYVIPALREIWQTESELNMN